MESKAIYAAVHLDNGNVTGSFTVNFLNSLDPLLSVVQSCDYASFGYTSPIEPPGSNFVQFSSYAFFVKVDNIPALSQISLIFNVLVTPLSIYYPTSATAKVNATSESDYTIVESTPSFKLESLQMQASFISYLAIFVVAFWVAAYSMDPKNYLEIRGWLK